MVNVTNHLEKRFTERTKLNKKSMTTFINKAVNDGIKFEQMKHKNNKLYKYLERMAKNGNHNVILYNRYVIIISEDDIVVTLLDLPRNCYELAEKLKKEMKGDENGKC